MGIRSAVPSSCYILSIMFWVTSDLDVRIMQSEMMYRYPTEHVANILCWVKGIRDENECAKLASTLSIGTARFRVSEKQKSGNMNNETIQMVQKELTQCNIALQRFVTFRPELQICPF